MTPLGHYPPHFKDKILNMNCSFKNFEYQLLIIDKKAPYMPLWALVAGWAALKKAAYSVGQLALLNFLNSLTFPKG